MGCPRDGCFLGLGAVTFPVRAVTLTGDEVGSGAGMSATSGMGDRIRAPQPVDTMGRVSYRHTGVGLRIGLGPQKGPRISLLVANVDDRVLNDECKLNGDQVSDVTSQGGRDAGTQVARRRSGGDQQSPRPWPGDFADIETQNPMSHDPCLKFWAGIAECIERAVLQPATCMRAARTKPSQPRDVRDIRIDDWSARTGRPSRGRRSWSAPPRRPH